MSAVAVLGRLHGAGVEVVYEAPGNIRLRGPLTPELVNLARAAKPELLALVRPGAQPTACACCGRFFLAEPTTVCFWCRSPNHPRNSRRSAEQGDEAGTSATFETATPGPGFSRACASCGGGLQPEDPDGATCWTCRSVPR